MNSDNNGVQSTDRNTAAVKAVSHTDRETKTI